MSKKIAVVTGANSGLGYQTTLGLCQRGTKVVMASRNREKAEDAQRRLLAEVPDAATEIILLDLSEPESIHEFGRQFSERVGYLDLLVNNAGVIGAPLAFNSVGNELQFATNYLGAFMLTGILLPRFRTGGSARIVNVGSLSNRFGKLELDDLNWEKTPYNRWKSYARSKLALLTFAVELDRRLRLNHSPVTALAAHPGFAPTEGAMKSTESKNQGALGSWWRQNVSVQLVPSPRNASRPILHAACSEHVSGGDYYGPGWTEIAGKPAHARINPVAKDPVTGKRLWELSEALTGVRYLSDNIQ